MITRTITIQTADGAQLLPVAELDFTNLVCDLEGQGIDVMAMMDGGLDRSKLMTMTRGILAVMTGIPVREAGRLLTQHLGNGGSLEDIFGVFTEAMADAGFGNRPTPQDHKKPQTRKTTTKK
ncbi:MAG: hypothetical protein LIR46_08335 [Bacteroidota bacterium]|jgi:hypothetical protein|nr:hypothetical protein [Bacteroidota bacterium]